MRMIKSVGCLLAAFLCLFSLAYGEESNEFITLPAGATHQGDYFAAGSNIEIQGTVTGDAFITGGQIFVHGEIDGDLIVMGGSVDVAGVIKGNIRILGGQITVNGRVERNATVLGGNVQLHPSAAILGNLVCIAGNCDLNAPVSGQALLIASNARISNAVGKDLSAYVGQLRITSRADIGGNLDIHSSEEPNIDPLAQISGETKWHRSVIKDVFHGRVLKGFLIGSKFLGLLMNFLFTFVIGVILMKLFPKMVSGAMQALDKRPWKACGIGLILLIGLPLASLLLLMTVLGAPFALALIALNVLSFYTAKIFSVSWAAGKLSQKVGWNLRPVPVLAIGLFVYYAFTLIPILGFIMALVALLFGLGSVTLGKLAHRR